MVRLYSDGIIEIDIYKKQWEECKEEEASILEEKEAISQLLLTEKEKEERISSIERFYQKFKENLENASYELKHQIIQLLVDKIIVKGDGLEIAYSFPLQEVLSEPAKNTKINKYDQFSSFCFNNERIQ